ncbi:MaoC family dehydratase [Hyphococcus luteus]|nr:MaoC family dehydratase [Marinicaulis flavus]
MFRKAAVQHLHKRNIQPIKPDHRRVGFIAMIVPEHGRGELGIDAIVDKGAGQGCLLRAVRQIFDASDNALIATVRQTSLLRGDGGCGSYGETLPPSKPVPDRGPDARMEIETRPEQALLYRLSGDYNPLHADPQVAADAGFPAPILHGLCTYAIAGKAILGWACDNDPALLRGLDCRFTAPVFPGERLLVEMWRSATDVVAFRASVPARETIVLDCGLAQLDFKVTDAAVQGGAAQSQDLKNKAKTESPA